jgi:hypothetical protein
VNGKCGNQFSQSRLQLYQHFNKRRAAALIELLDTLCSNPYFPSVISLSLSPYSRRHHNSKYKAIEAFPLEDDPEFLTQLLEPYLSPPQKRKFWLFGGDVSAYPRPHATRLADRTYVYQPNPVKGNKPVIPGHAYSNLFHLPERNEQEYPHWALPLSGKRVNSKADKREVMVQQIYRWLNNPHLSWYQQFGAFTGDSDYSTPPFLAAISPLKNLVGIIRVRSNRVFSCQPKATHKAAGPGRPVLYGKTFKLGDKRTWPKPDDTATVPLKGYKGKEYQFEILAWHNLLMRGKRKPTLIPMQNYPFTLLRICLLNAKGKPVHKKPLWLILIGERRQEISLSEGLEAYLQRYDIEHFYRFSKQKLLLDRFQTSLVQNEEKWWPIANLAYLELWMARKHCVRIIHPWEHHLRLKNKPASPPMVQRSFGGIIWQFGTPAPEPKRRGNSPGRPLGTVSPPRTRQPIIHKGKK